MILSVLLGCMIPLDPPSPASSSAAAPAVVAACGALERPDPAAPVLVEMLDLRPGAAAVGFRVLPDGRWQETDSVGAWVTLRTLTPEQTTTLTAQVTTAQRSPLVPPDRQVSDAVGCTAWRLNTQTVSVPAGHKVEALTTLYNQAHALPGPVAGSLWDLGGVRHTVACSAASVPALSAVARAMADKARSVPGDDRPLVTPGAALLRVSWLENSEVIGESVVLADGRVGSTMEGKLMHRRTLDAAGLAALQAALAAVPWDTVCAPR